MLGALPRCTGVHILAPVALEWDRDKAESNARKHGVDFADAASVLEDEFALTLEEEHDDEVRFVTLGRDALDRVLVVVHTRRGANIRLISARFANRREQASYEEAR